MLDSIETESGDFCVDFFQREDGSFGFEPFRRDVEDSGKWTGIHYYSSLSYFTLGQAQEIAVEKISWLQIKPDNMSP